MGRLTLKRKSQLAVLIAGVLLFNSIPALNMLAYAQEDGSQRLSDSVTGGDMSGGTVSGATVSTEAKLNKVTYSVSSGASEEIIPEGDLLEGDGITRCYKENVNVEFELAANSFNESDLKVSDSYYEGSGKTLQYSVSSENGGVKVICGILAEDEGTHELSFHYYDRSYDRNVSYKTQIIIDTTPAETESVSGRNVLGINANNTSPKVTEVIYTGSLRVENEQGDVIEITEGSVNNIAETMHVFTKEEVELDYKLIVENPDDMHYIKIFHVTNGISEEITGAVWNNSENNEKEWTTSITVSGQGKHRVLVEYQKDDISVKDSSATIYIDDTEAKLNKVTYFVGSGQPVEIIPEGDLLEGDGITRCYKETVKVEFELAENFFHKSDLKVSDSYYEGSDKTLQYSTSTDNGVTKVICEILAEDEGTHELSFHYYDKIYERNVSYKTEIIIDTIPAEIESVEYSPWVKAEDGTGAIVADETEEEQNAIKQRKDCTLYYKDDVEITFHIKEANFYKEGVTVFDNGVENTDISWSVEHEENEGNDIYSVKCCIPKSLKGDHVIELKYQDKTGNEPPISFISNKIRIDSQKSNFTVKYTDWTSAWSATGNEEILQYTGGTREDVILYHNDSMTLTFEITEEYFQEKDVQFSDAYNGEINNTVLNWEPDDAADNLWRAQYAISEEGDHKVSLSYQDRSGNEPSIEYVSERIVLDDTSPVLSDVTITPCAQKVEDKLYYSDKVDITFTIEEKNFNGGDVVLRDNGTEMAATLTWEQVTGENSNSWTATYDIPKEKAGEHFVALEYGDRSGNSSIEYASETIIIDSQKPEIILGSNEPKPDETGEKKIIYLGEGQKLRLYIKEENFRAADVDATVSVGGAAAEEIEEEIDAQIQDPSNWTKVPDGYVSYIDLSNAEEYDIIFNCTDLARNAAEESALVIVDIVSPKVVEVSYDTDLCKRMVDSNNETVTTADADTRYIYQEPMTFELTIEEHFDAALAEVSVYRDGIKLENNDGYNVSWTTADANLHRHTLSVGLGGKDGRVLDGDYLVKVDCIDSVLNTMDTYTSNIITIDKTNPEIDIDYDNENEKNVTYYNKDRVAAITVTDRNVVPGEIKVSVTGKDIDDNVLPYDLAVKQSPWSPGKEQGTWISTITYDMEANYEFKIECRDMAGNYSRESDRFTIDKTAPDSEESDSSPASEGTIPEIEYKLGKAPIAIAVELNESAQKLNDVSYCAENINVTISIDAADFHKEDVKARISKDGGEQYAAEMSWRTIAADKHIGSVTLEKEGSYKVYVSYRNPSTNEIEDYQSELLIIDKTQPSVSVAGIKHNSANNQEQISLVVTVEDANLNADSFQPKLLAKIRDESGNIRQVDCTELGTIETVTDGESYTYTIPNMDQDGIYQLTCLVSDMAGNTTDYMNIEEPNQQAAMQLDYSVNRNGSIYSFGEGTKKLINKFVKKAADVVIYEANPDEISNIKITLFKNDETIILEDGKDYTVNRVSDDGDWYMYEYTIYDTNFEEEGTYRISVYSEDKAGNIAENNQEVKDAEISFDVDKTLPDLIVTDLESKAIYPVDRLSVQMKAADNMKLQDISVELDGKEIASWNEEQIQEMSNNGEDFVFDISGDETNAHTMIITLTDAAGNQRIESISDFYVTKNLGERFINNKVLFYGAVITCLATGAVIALLGRRRWKRKRFTGGENH